jgi:ketosteroid isomerase-like protein
MMQGLLPIFALVGLGILGCGKRTEQTKDDNNKVSTIPKNASPDKRVFPAPVPGSPEMEVWNGELALFQAKDLDTFMSLWDDNFVGWPDYSELPARKWDFETSAKDDFQAMKPSGSPLLPVPLAVTVFGDVAVTQYFWPEADVTSPVRYRATHTWKKGPNGWRIISGMSCAVPRARGSNSTK